MSMVPIGLPRSATVGGCPGGQGSRRSQLGRMRVLDAKPVNLDGFSVANPDLGLVAMHSPFDPEPSLVVRDGVVVELDGKTVDGLRRDRRVHRPLRAGSRRRRGGHGARRSGAGPHGRRLQRAARARWSA